MNNFEVIIGIEIHLELNTKTKFFSPSPIDFEAEANTLVHPIDLGYPGTLPRVNKQAIINGIKLAKALNMTIDSEIHFDRKNYFYPDLPKGFQITQQFRPIGKNGSLVLYIDDESVKIDIERIHLEEDTARQYIKENEIWYDFNRAGIPLIEIVTRPTIKSSKQASSYIDEIRKIALLLEISDARMDRGSLRADINVSLRPYGSDKLGTKVEIKNLNSLNNVKKAIDLEIKDQFQKLINNQEIIQVTKRFNEKDQVLETMRKKESTINYMYFPEPNIPIIKLEQDFIDKVQINELPNEKKLRYQKANINKIYINLLINDPKLSKYFDKINYDDKEKISNIFFSEIVALANKQNRHATDLNIKASDIEDLLKELEQGNISGKHLKKLIPLLVDNQKEIKELLEENKMILISDQSYLRAKILEIIEANSKIVEEYNQRAEKVTKFILGSLMSQTNGQANPVVSSKLVKEILEEKFK